MKLMKQINFQCFVYSLNKYDGSCKQENCGPRANHVILVLVQGEMVW